MDKCHTYLKRNAIMHHDVSKNVVRNIQSRIHYALALVAFVVGFTLLSAEPAMAQQSPMGNVICFIIGIIYGNLGRGLAVLAVIIVGVGATLGKVSWGLAMTVGIGVGTIFGAVPLVAYLISGNSLTPICYGVGGVD
jgi:type IV secretory pathway VirB2 component (pilin)